jgi:hypothetical protein
MRLQPLLTVYNQHTELCGPSPWYSNDPEDGQPYIGYFENSYGEQCVFVFDRITRRATLRGGDIQWDNVREVVDLGGVAHVPGIVIDEDERAWLQACWNATRYVRERA